MVVIKKTKMERSQLTRLVFLGLKAIIFVWCAVVSRRVALETE